MMRQIKYFQAVVKNNSFSEAAVECHISQSAISQQVKSLEEDLGIKLLERKNRKFSLTPAGEHFYKKSLVLAARNPLSELERITVWELKNTPCILVASKDQQEIELDYYRNVVGFKGEILFAENMEEARLMVIVGKGFMPSEGTPIEGSLGTNIKRLPLFREKNPVTRNYCGFWRKDNSNPYGKIFADNI